MKLLKTEPEKIDELLLTMDRNDIYVLLSSYFYSTISKIVHFNIKNIFGIPVECDDISCDFIQNSCSIVKKYKYRPEASFITFLTKSVKNFCYTKVNYWRAKKRAFNSNCVSLDELHYVEDKNSLDEMNYKIDELDYFQFNNSLNQNDLKILNILKCENKNFYTTHKLNEYRQILVNKINNFYN